MQRLSEIVPEVISALKSVSSLADVLITPEYKGGLITPPLSVSAVAVGIAGITPFEDIIGNYEGTDAGGQAFAARSSRIILRFSIYTPAGCGGASDVDIAAAVSEVLFGAGAPYTFTGCETGEMKFDKITGALLRVMTAEMQALLEI